MTHTPGPIRVREQNELDKTLKCVRLEDDKGVFVLVVDEKYGDLIAAAPDMLEALKGAKWLIDCYVAKPEGYEEYQDMLKAIKKARGEE